MACELHDDAAWPALLAARTTLAATPGDLLFVQRHGQWQCSRAAGADLSGAQGVLVVIDPRATSRSAPTVPAGCAWTIQDQADDGVPRFLHPTAQPVSAALLSMARVYLPVLVGAALARSRGAVFVAGHVTQTLDGRIACLNGQSQWIGNDADLRHAHRMRALLDGVLVGAGTALTDDPQLNVRHVHGPDPRRIVLSGNGRVLQRPALRLFRAPGCDVVVADDVGSAPPAVAANLVRVRRSTGGSLEPGLVLAALRAEGVHSIYLEGGAATLSSFLHAGAVDVLQVHIAAMVLGSGLPAFSLPPVDHVQHGLRFAMDHATLHGHVLLSCWPSARTSGPA